MQADVTGKGQKAAAEQGSKLRACSAVQSHRAEETSGTGILGASHTAGKAWYGESGAEPSCPTTPMIPLSLVELLLK